MVKSNRAKITVNDVEIMVESGSYGEEDYISLTDMTKSFEGGNAPIEQWVRNKDTIIFLGTREKLYNPNFNSPEFEGIRNRSGTGSFYLSVKKWIERTNARGIIASAGRYGGTFAHKDISSSSAHGFRLNLNCI
ncbi:MAG: KilA-N domain-containing protein [Methanomassiliicoccaceae archaeon]|nr:KilA-N domain-containing protein [Methanomassiliicoccaceae archaeon]